MEKSLADNVAPFAGAVIRLMQGPLYDDEARFWHDLLLYQQPLREYIGRIGVRLHLDEANGFAFLTQPEPEEGEAKLPRLVRRMPLSYEVTLLLVVLRECLEEFDVQNTDSSRCFVSHEELLERIELLFKDKADKVKLVARLDSYVQQALALGFLREVKTRRPGGETSVYEIRRLIKAKLSNQKLEEIKESLEKHAQTHQ
jgi:hypothetical protein